jgi:hypothetical protein
MFEAFEQAGADFIPTTELLNALVNREDGPWAAWWANDVEAGRTKGPAAKLAALLRPFGITPTKQRVGQDTIRGYDRAAFNPIWERWLPSLPTSTLRTEQSEQTSLDAGFGDFASRNIGVSIPTSALRDNPHQMRVVPSVPSLSPPVCRSALPPFDDCDRRAVVVRMGENLGWSECEFKPGTFIAKGEERWRTFAATASGEDITLALRALEAYAGPGDG